MGKTLSGLPPNYFLLFRCDVIQPVNRFVDLAVGQSDFAADAANLRGHELAGTVSLAQFQRALDQRKRAEFLGKRTVRNLLSPRRRSSRKSRA